MGGRVKGGAFAPLWLLPEPVDDRHDHQPQHIDQIAHRVRDEMERDAKRKAPGAASPENEGRASKRLKLPVSAIKCARRGIVGGA